MKNKIFQYFVMPCLYSLAVKIIIMILNKTKQKKKSKYIIALPLAVISVPKLITQNASKKTERPRNRLLSI